MSIIADGKLWQPLKFWAAASLAHYTGYLMTLSSNVQSVLHTNHKMVLPTNRHFKCMLQKVFNKTAVCRANDS
jgi:hypothetical protein